MRVAVVHNLGSGGARRRLQNQLEHLSVEYVEICLATAVPVTENPHVVPFRPLSPALPRPARIPFRYLDFARLTTAWSAAGRAVRRSGADVVFANPCQFLQSPAALLVRGLPPSLYFCDEPRRVDTEAESQASRNPRTRQIYGPLWAAERRVDRGATARATRIVTNSRFTAGSIEAAYGRHADPVRLGVPPDFADAGSGAPGAARHVLSVGTVIPSKGHDLAIEAAAAARQRRPVLVIGPRAAEGEEARLRALAGRLGVDLTIALGVSDDELRRAYRDAYATLYLAYREPLGLASLEAQALGCPVIVADEGGLPETIEEGVTGWAVPRRGDAAGAALDRLEDVDRGALADAARRHAATWTWQESGRRIEQELRALVP